MVEEVKVEELEVETRMIEEEEEAHLEGEEEEISFQMVIKPIVQVPILEEDILQEVEEETKGMYNVIIVTNLAILRESVD